MAVRSRDLLPEPFHLMKVNFGRLWPRERWKDDYLKFIADDQDLGDYGKDGDLDKTWELQNQVELHSLGQQEYFCSRGRR